MLLYGAGIKQHSGQNQQLRAGLQALGVHCGEIPRNCSPEHTCGHCCFGCPSGDKQDMTATFLPDAVAAGARILTGADTVSGCSRAPKHACPELPFYCKCPVAWLKVMQRGQMHATRRQPQP